MAQDFERHIARSTGTSGATIFTSNSDDAVSSANYYLVKGINIPSGSSVELIDGASRFVVVSGDALKVDCDTDNALDVWVSVVDAIS